MRGDVKAGGGGGGEKKELATITIKFSFPSCVKTVTANVLQITKVTTACLV